MVVRGGPWGRASHLAPILAVVVLLLGCGSGASTSAGRPVSAVVSTSPDGDEGEGATTASTTEAPPSATRPAPVPVSLLFAGDVLIHEPVAEAARLPDGTFDFAPLFAPVRELVSDADVAICHLEVPLDRDDTDLSGYPLFRAPREVAAGLAATGFDGCSTASNHSLDQGTDGISSTLDALDAAGLAHTGTGRSAAEAGGPAVYRVGDVDVAHLSYTFGTNGIPLPGDAPWSVRLIDAEQIVSDARNARAIGAEVVVVSLHWGVEYQSEVTGEQTALAQLLRDSGELDLIVGHHAHVVQPIDGSGGTWVVFGMGNFVSNQTTGCCPPASQDGLMVRVEMLVAAGARPTVQRVAYTPLRVDRAGGYRVVPVGEALADPALAGTLGPQELRDSFARTEAVVASRPDPILVPSAPPPG